LAELLAQATSLAERLLASIIPEVRRSSVYARGVRVAKRFSA
jgi:hypothetical protein